MSTDRHVTGSGLLWKLLAINVPILVLVLVSVWLSIDTLAAGYFGELMQRYHISPEETNQMFLDAVHRYLVWTIVGGVILAALSSYVLTRRVLRPLSEMAAMTRQVAEGNYDARATVRGRDELADLAGAFNAMAASLERLERLRKDLVADVAHELRTPLTNVRGYLEALKDGVVAPDPATYDMLQQEVRRLATLADDLLELARADAAHAHLRMEPIDLRDLIGTTLAMNADRFEDRGIRVHERYPGPAPTVRADREKLLQAVGNLVENGWQYGKAGTDFTVEARPVDHAVRVTFSNPADAIPDADLNLIFERFYRLEQSRSRDFGGAGIGLAIVKELIEAHGGSVGAERDDDQLQIWVELPA